MSGMRHQLLGEILVREGKLQEQQLAEALDAQEIFGGRLGTNLVDLELLPALEVGWYLALQLRVPEARPEDFLAVTPRLLEQFPRELAGRLQVFPLRSVERVLHLAMVSPTDLPQIDEVTFATGLRVQPYVAPELRMLFFLEQRYGFARDKRFVRVRADEPGASRDATREVEIAVPPNLGETTLSDTRGGGLEIASSVVRGDPTGPFTTGAPYRPSRLTPPPSRTVLAVAAPTAPPAPAVSVPTVPPAIASDEISEADLELVFLDDARATRGTTEEDEDFEVTLVEPEEPAARPAFAALMEATAPSTIDELFADLDSDAPAAPAPSIPPPAPPVPAPVPAAPAPRRTPAPELTASPVDLGAALALELARATSKEEVVGALLRACSDRPSVSVLFLVRGETAVATAARGSELAEAELARLVLPLASSPLLQTAAERGEPVLGSAAEDPMLQVISGFLRSAAPAEACVAPVVLARRAVNLLCVQAPLGNKLPQGIREGLADLCSRAAAAYARLIRELKRKP